MHNPYTDVGKWISEYGSEPALSPALLERGFGCWLGPLQVAAVLGLPTFYACLLTAVRVIL